MSKFERPSEIEVPLVVSNVDLDDESTLEAIALRLSDLAWIEVSGQVVATAFFTEDADIVSEAVCVARRISTALPDSTVTSVYQDLVSASDIAERVGVSREAVRLWAKDASSAGMPSPIASVGGGTRGATKVWRWSEVTEWLWESRKVDLGQRLLHRRQIVDIDARLEMIPTPADEAWQAEQERTEARPLYAIPDLYVPGSHSVWLNVLRARTVTNTAHWHAWHVANIAHSYGQALEAGEPTEWLDEDVSGWTVV